MASKLEICNMALALAGNDPISDLDEGTQASRNCLLFYDSVKKAKLRGHLWNFAMRRVELAQITTPIFEWDYAYALPVDCLRVTKLNESDDDYHVEGRTLVCNEDSAKISYISDVYEGDFDACFVPVMYYGLGIELARVLTRDNRKATELAQYLKDIVLPEAQGVDGQEASGDEIKADLFLEQRLGAAYI